MKQEPEAYAHHYAGRCHCGDVRVVLHSDKAPDTFTPRADQCGFCVRHRVAAVSDPAGLVELSAPRDLEPYRFGLGITDFFVCGRCGVFVAAVWHKDGGTWAVVNMPALDDRDGFSAEAVPMDFDGEDVAAREARRRRSWTPTRLTLTAPEARA
ncbi:hypothetical protein [Novosphingobium mangrovi (ex Huang et al. 2023)]|uniref:CENP-V/GFA domain-containing protein n=1 Tax=Novosphingobium mangrovi (ex Huang et al. 2023) TaxID=2976432 RepID=A0ABT2I2W0_9SPHN|nr:hypothetical protein [Novosphingobium mangrovi (ex Huang et al. 2023)]MCT2399144.1 hypothetical protein [Novosphingobium mangrovi (ex Huang et al. 2023)]